MNSEFEHSEITRKIIGCAMEVHNCIGSGFQEVIYQRALALEFTRHEFSYSRETQMQIYYKFDLIGSRRVDFLVENQISVEIKAMINLDQVHLAQALNYLEAFNLRVGLLLNFVSMRLEFHRLHNRKLKM